MIGVLKPELWSWARVPKLDAWTLNRDWHQTEADRLLKGKSYSEAEDHLIAAVDEADERGAFASKRIRLRLRLAEVQRRRAHPEPGASGYQQSNPEKLTAAEETVRQALAIAAKISDQVSYMNCLDALADVFADQGNFTALQKLEEEAIRLGSQIENNDPLRAARRVRLLGFARYRNGRSEDAVATLEKAVELHIKDYGPKHLQTASLYLEVGQVYMDQGNPQKAQECFRNAWEIHQAEYGVSSNESLNGMQRMAEALEAAGDYEEAAAKYERILGLRAQQIGSNLEQIGEMQYSLANLYVEWGNLGRARELLTECVGRFKRAGGPRLAVAQETLAQLEEQAGRFLSAVKELEHAAKAWEKCGPSRHKELGHNLLYQAELLDQVRQQRKASDLRKRAEQYHGTADAPA